MFKNIPSLQRLIRQLQHVPYLASKNLYRVASHLISSDKKNVEQLCSAILDAKDKIRSCKKCFNWTEQNEICEICLCSRRDKSTICVVETWHDLIAIERTQDYTGLYHVLGGSLSPLQGVGPDELTIDALISRIDASFEEIILATNPTPEGEATASFIASKITGIKISRLASGVPIGYCLEQMDRVTIHKAISGRRPF
jgi:recombination protein RecR